ncbi:LYR motif-containing protein At3g19508 isoform X3 [Arachis hypogaea]|uniref:LYR motif-containing protein At3g19508 isoform X3 n=1 Tax=Arachis hypogaea TaxID=3818 RepID=UPI003B21263F
MEKALRAYAEVLRLVRRLPKESRGYYAKYARENFVNYRDVDPSDSTTLHDLFQRTYNHSIWLLHKYSVDDSAADKLKRICCGTHPCVMLI